MEISAPCKWRRGNVAAKAAGRPQRLLPRADGRMNMSPPTSDGEGGKPCRATIAAAVPLPRPWWRAALSPPRGFSAATSLSQTSRRCIDFCGRPKDVSTPPSPPFVRGNTPPRLSVRDGNSRSRPAGSFAAAGQAPLSLPFVRLPTPPLEDILNGNRKQLRDGKGNAAHQQPINIIHDNSVGDRIYGQTRRERNG